MISLVRRHWPSALCAAFVSASLTAGCADKPTEVVVSVVSNLSCESSSVAAVAVGIPGELGNRGASSTSTVCYPDGSRGDLVVVPKASKNSEFALEVRIRADAGGNVEDCTEAQGYQNCVVARRILNFIPGRTVHMRVDLRDPCLNTPCSPLTTCIAKGTTKSCLEAKVDVTKCSGTCDEDTQVMQHPDPVDQCAVNPCAASAACQVTEGVVECVCASGFQHPKDDPLACEDIDECKVNGGQCDVHAKCTNTPGGATCDCDEGYVSNDDDSTCTQVECTTQCATGGACVRNAAGKFNCSCLPGYSGNGVTCINIDECKTGTNDCDALAPCVDTPGSYHCGACPAGYLDTNGDGTECVDIDECKDKTATCATKAKCTNTPGAFTCQCSAGYLDTNGDGTECVDIDECKDKTATCATKAKCTNTPGAFTCQCPAGYLDTNGDGTECVDIDECSDKTATCAASATCTNTPGAFTCQCPAGYTDANGDGSVCACWSVLVLGSSTSGPTTLLSQMQAANAGICKIDYASANDPFPILAGYSSVLVYNDLPFNDPVAVGDALAKYFDGGGQVVVAPFADAGYAVSGNWIAKNYNLLAALTIGTSIDSFSSAEPTQNISPLSPVLTGVENITTSGGWHGEQAVANGGTAVALWASGLNLAVTGVITDSKGVQHKRVDLNVHPNDISTGTVSGDAVRLLANAVVYR